MTTLLSYIRIFVFMGGTLAGVQVPFFVDQYGKSLESHFLESQRAVAEFQDDANKFFGGDLSALIDHYKNSGDKVFNEGGTSIQAIYNRYLTLKTSLANYQSSHWNAYSQALFKPVTDVRDEVAKNYSYAVKLDGESILFGLCTGLIGALGIEFVLRTVAAVLGAIFSRARGTHSRA